MMVLRFSMQGECVIEHSDGKCHAIYILVCKRRIFLSIRMSSVTCVQFQSTRRPLSNIGVHLITTLNILVPRY